MSLDVEKLRRETPGVDHRIHLNNAGAGQARPSQQAMTEPPHRTLTPGRLLVLAGRVVDLDAGVLRDAEGVPIALRPQAWAVLCVLAQHPDCVVTKDQLFNAVWPGLVVTDSSLARAISDLRRAFGADGHSAIKTAAMDGIVSGDTDAKGTLTGAFGPERPINRAEVSKILSVAIQVYRK